MYKTVTEKKKITGRLDRTLAGSQMCTVLGAPWAVCVVLAAGTVGAEGRAEGPVQAPLFPLPSLIMPQYIMSTT